MELNTPLLKGLLRPRLPGNIRVYSDSAAVLLLAVGGAKRDHAGPRQTLGQRGGGHPPADRVRGRG